MAEGQHVSRVLRCLYLGFGSERVREMVKRVWVDDREADV
jgi:hypothetical protein